MAIAKSTLNRLAPLGTLSRIPIMIPGIRSVIMDQLVARGYYQGQAGIGWRSRVCAL